jgi:hypothetical protein
MICLLFYCLSFFYGSSQPLTYCVFVEKVDSTYLNANYLLIHGRAGEQKLKVLMNIGSTKVQVFENRVYPMVLDDLFDLYDLNFKGDTIVNYHGDPPESIAYTLLTNAQEVVTIEFPKQNNFYQCLAILFDSHSVLQKRPCLEPLEETRD